MSFFPPLIAQNPTKVEANEGIDTFKNEERAVTADKIMVSDNTFLLSINKRPQVFSFYEYPFTAMYQWFR